MRSRSGRRRRARGQALVEFTIVIPVFMVLLSAMLEFGLAFSDRLTLGNATREGARIGAALVTGMKTTCTGDPAGVDNTIVASVQNILDPGSSEVQLEHVTAIRIFKSTSSGGQSGSSVNVWTYTPGSGPDADPGSGIEVLDFSPSSTGWAACSRRNTAGSPDSIGVTVDYSYQLKTPLAALITLIGGTRAGTIRLVDTTVMALNPTS
jgi:hypothetical protein